MEQKYNFPVIYLVATRRCNLSCYLCMSGSNDEKLVKARLKDELTYDEIVELILKPAKKLGAFHIQFGGGEFLLCP